MPPVFSQRPFLPVSQEDPSLSVQEDTEKGPKFQGQSVSSKGCLVGSLPLSVCHCLIHAKFGVGSYVLQLEPPDIVLQSVLWWTKNCDSQEPGTLKWGIRGQKAIQGKDITQT